MNDGVLLPRGWWQLVPLGVVAAVIAYVAAPEPRPSGHAAAAAVLGPMSERAATPAGLPARQALPRSREDLFAARSWAPPAPPPAPAVQAAPEPPPAPSVPPNPYRFAGTAHYAGSLKAVFIRDERVHTAKAGETLDGGYKVLSVGREAVTVLYAPLNVEQRMVFAEVAAENASAPVQAPPGVATSGVQPPPFPRGSPLAER